MAGTSDRSLVIADGKVALELSACIPAAGAQAHIREAGGGRLPYLGVVPDFDMNTASFCHVRDEFWIEDAELLSLTLTTRPGGSTGFVRIDR